MAKISLITTAARNCSRERRKPAACTAGPDPRLHANALELMETLQITVINREV